MKYLEMDGRLKVFQAVQNGYGIKKALYLLRLYKEYHIKFWGWDLIFKVGRYAKSIMEQCRIRIRDKKMIIK